MAVTNRSSLPLGGFYARDGIGEADLIELDCRRRELVGIAGRGVEDEGALAGREETAALEEPGGRRVVDEPELQGQLIRPSTGAPLLPPTRRLIQPTARPAGSARQEVLRGLPAPFSTAARRRGVAGAAEGARRVAGLERARRVSPEACLPSPDR